jgi:hypothetical protein
MAPFWRNFPLRATLQPYLGQEISGSGTITEICLNDILLKNIRGDPDIEEEHCWIQRTPNLINIALGEKIYFIAIVYKYRKKVGSQFKIDYGLRIFEWDYFPLLQM